MLAYGGALRDQGWGTTVARALRRAWEIYAAFLVLLFAYAALVWMAGGGSRYLDETKLGLLFRNPGPAIVHAVAERGALFQSTRLAALVRDRIPVRL